LLSYISVEPEWYRW